MATVALQMDPPASLKPATDSSLLLGLEAQRRGHTLFYYHPRTLSWSGGEVRAKAHSLTLRENPNDFFTLGTAETLDLSTCAVVLMRQDPPFDMGYITATHLLERIHPHTLVVNNPAAVREAPEKILPLQFSQFMPPTLITSSEDELRRFQREQGELVLKPLYGYAGNAVVRIPADGTNLGAVWELFMQSGPLPLIAQQFLPDVHAQETRVILIDGEIKAAMRRVPAAGEIRVNFRVGGHGEKTELTKSQRTVCEALGPYLKENGLIFAGLDLIGDKLIEVNLTSPTGLPAVNMLNGLRLERDIWDAIEERM